MFYRVTIENVCEAGDAVSYEGKTQRCRRDLSEALCETLDNHFSIFRIEHIAASLLLNVVEFSDSVKVVPNEKWDALYAAAKTFMDASGVNLELTREETSGA